MRMVQWMSGCDYYLLSYEYFYLAFALQIGLKRCFSPQQLERRCGPTATPTSLKVTWNKGPDQAFQGKRLNSRN